MAFKHYDIPLESLPGEEWKPIPWANGAYSVSSCGRVRSEARKAPRQDGSRQSVPARILRQNKDSFGYWRVSLWGETNLVHALMLEAFTGPRPVGAHACHNNGNPSDNRPDNLRWDTPAGNHADKRIHGTLLIGSKHPCAKLTEDQVREIRSRYRKRGDGSSLAREFGITNSYLTTIVARGKWKHI